MTRDSYAALQLKIEKEISRLQKQAQALRAKQRAPIIASIIRSMREYDIAPEEIATAFNKKSARAARPVKTAVAQPPAARKVAPKYMDPATGNSWTGRGKTPRWITQAESEGRNRDDFLIQR